VLYNVYVCLFGLLGLRTGRAVHCEETSSVTVLYLDGSAHCSNVRTSKASATGERSYCLADVFHLYKDASTP
jgi:hypothetical protein